MDFSNHVLSVITDSILSIKVYNFAIPGQYSQSFKFVNIPDNHSRGNLIVTGDYGNWIFSQTFYPQPGAPSNVPYMLEKLKMHSTQEYSFYDRDETEKQIKERLAELNNSDNCGYKGSKLKELLEYYKECLEQVDDEIDYIERARNIPRFMDCESCMILGKVLNKQLEVVFLAFDEICKRLES